MAEKTVNAKQPEKAKVVQKAKAPERDRDKDKPREPNRIERFWRETVGELRKVSWPTLPEARRLTLIVLAVMFGMSVLLGSLDFVFSRLMSLLVK